MDRAVRSHLDIELFVVRFLFHAVVLDRVLDVLDRSMDRIDGEQAELCIGGPILVGRHVSASLVDRELHLDLYVGVQPADHQLGIQHLEIRKEVRDIAGRQLRLPGHVDRHLLAVDVLDGLNETHLLEIQNDLEHSFHYTGDSSKLMVYARHFHGRDGIPLERTQQDTTQRVADGHSESRLQRTKLKPSEGGGGLEHDYLFRLLKC